MKKMWKSKMTTQISGHPVMRVSNAPEDWEWVNRARAARGLQPEKDKLSLVCRRCGVDFQSQSEQDAIDFDDGNVPAFIIQFFSGVDCDN